MLLITVKILINPETKRTVTLFWFYCRKPSGVIQSQILLTCGEQQSIHTLGGILIYYVIKLSCFETINVIAADVFRNSTL